MLVPNYWKKQEHTRPPQTACIPQTLYSPLSTTHSKANNQNSTTDKRMSSEHKDEHTWATSQSPMVHRNILLEKKDTAFNPQTESRPKIIRQESPIMCTFKSRHNPGHAFIKHGVFAKLIRGLFNHGLWVLGRWPKRVHCLLQEPENMHLNPSAHMQTAYCSNILQSQYGEVESGASLGHTGQLV